jgi:hypothetical protein
VRICGNGFEDSKCQKETSYDGGSRKTSWKIFEGSRKWGGGLVGSNGLFYVGGERSGKGI